MIFITLLPTLIEAYLDRKGETKKGKFKDTLWLLVGSAVLTGGVWWLGYRPLPVIGLILGWRVLVFDYLTNWFLKRYHEGHKDINIWKFTGTVAYTDRLIAKIDWRIRLGLRTLLFSLAVWFYTIHGSA